MNGGGFIGVVFGTGDAAPINAAIFVIVLASLLAIFVATMPLNVGLSPQQMLSNLADTAGMCLAYIFGRSGARNGGTK